MTAGSKFDYDSIPDEDKCRYVSFDEIDIKTYYEYKSIESLEKLSFDILHKVCDLKDTSFDGTGNLLSTVEKEVANMVAIGDVEGLTLVCDCISKVLCSVQVDPDSNDDSTDVILSLSYLHRNSTEFLGLKTSLCNI